MRPGAPNLAWRDELVVLGADDRAGLIQELRYWLAALEKTQPPRLKELACCISEGYEWGGSCLAIVASSVGDLQSKLQQALVRLADSACVRIQSRNGIYWFDRPFGPSGRIAMLFPGEGSQYPNMLADLAVHFPLIRQPFDLVAQAFADNAGLRNLCDLIFSPGTAADERLFLMDVAATAVFAGNLGLFRLLEAFGVRADAVAGHSTGEYSALYAAGALRFDDDAALMTAIRELNAVYRGSVLGIPEGVLVGVGGLPAERVRVAMQSIGGTLRIAMHNCPNQVVIFGCSEEVDALTADLQANGGVVLRLPFGRPYHTPLFAGFADRLEPFLRALAFEQPRIELWSCATASRFPPDRDAIRDLALAQWTRPVRFHDTIAAMHDAGVRIFVEAGPRGHLTSFVEDILRDRPFSAVAMDLPRRSGIRQLCHVLALLAAHGRKIDFGPLYAGRTVRPATREQLLATMARRGPVRLALGLPVLTLAPKPAAGMPLIEDVLALQPSEEAVAERRFNLAQDLFLRDHALGGQVSTVDRDLSPLVLLPLTISMEMMAEAASLLFPGMRVVGLRSVRAHRWITFEGDTVRLRAHATRHDDCDVLVRLMIVGGPGEADLHLAAEGLVQFAEVYPPAPTAPRRPSPARIGDVADRYGRAMFSGPRFQSVRALCAVAADAVEAELEVLPAADFFAGQPAPKFLIDPVLLDGAGQSVGFWTAEMWPDRFVIFPVGVEALTLHGPPRRAGERIGCHAQIRMAGADDLASTIDLTTADGHLHARLTGWADRRFDVTALASAFVLAPNRHAITVDAARLAGSPLSRPGRVCRIADSLDPNIVPFTRPVWQEVLARLILSRTERKVWDRFARLPLAVRQKRAVEWLMGRLAAKDAVRAWVKRQDGPDLFPADIEIGTTASGRPEVAIAGLCAAPDMSLSHCGSPAAAAAIVAGCGEASGGETSRLGIDIERLRPLDGAFAETVFDSNELALLADPDQRDEWLLRGWTAKEAAAKAGGGDDAPRPLEWRVCGVDRGTGTVRVARHNRETTLSASTQTAAGLTLAILQTPEPERTAENSAVVPRERVPVGTRRAANWRLA